MKVKVRALATEKIEGIQRVEGEKFTMDEAGACALRDEGHVEILKTTTTQAQQKAAEDEANKKAAEEKAAAEKEAAEKAAAKAAKGGTSKDQDEGK